MWQNLQESNKRQNELESFIINEKHNNLQSNKEEPKKYLKEISNFQKLN